VTPFVLQAADQFLPDGPPSLLSGDWVEAFNEIKLRGSATNSARTDAETATALFWTANVIRQYNQALRDVINANRLTLLESVFGVHHGDRPERSQARARRRLRSDPRL
jgi:hypothetical protein